MGIPMPGRAPLLAGLAALVSGCSSANLPDYILLGDVRVLSIIADHPEASPGDTVSFTPVVSDVNGGGRPLSYSVQACIDPGVGLGGTPACASPDPASVQSGTTVPPANTAGTYTGAATGFTLTMPDEATIFAGRSAVDRFNGVGYLVFYTVGIPSAGISVTAMKRVIVSEASKSPKNQNPAFASLTAGGQAIGSPLSTPGSPLLLAASFTDASAESYLAMQASGATIARQESLITTWFESEGKFQYFRTEGSGAGNSWTPPSPPITGRGIVIVPVVRDGRGGEAFSVLEIH